MKIEPIRGSCHHDLAWQKVLVTPKLVKGKAKSGKRLKDMLYGEGKFFWWS